MIKLAGRENQVRKFNRKLRSIRKLNDKVADDLEIIPAKQWALAHDSGHRFGETTTNLSECYNNVLKGTRHLPITALVQHTFYKCVSYFADRADKARSLTSAGQRFSKHAISIFDRWADKCRQHGIQLYDRE